MLHLAALGNKINALAFFLKCGLDPNLKDNMGFIPLHKSAFNCSKDATKCLVLWGADMNA